LGVPDEVEGDAFALEDYDEVGEGCATMRNQDRRTSQRIRKNRCASGRCTNKRKFRTTSRIRRELSLRTRLLQSRQTSRQQLRKLNLNTLDISFTTTWTLMSTKSHME
jgi:hypothetical protein